MATNLTPENLVFKVKCGDDLKRINGSVNGELLSSNLGLLKSKIRECFAITPDKNFHLTYVDVDGDTVMLADGSDLYDVTVKQGLNPVRINVELICHETKLKSGQKHGEQRTEVKTGMKAEPSSPASYLVGAADTAPNGKYPKQAQAKPESSNGQTTVHKGIKCYVCGKFTIMGRWNGNYNDTCPKCASLGWRTEAGSSWRDVSTDKVPTESYHKSAPKSAWNSYTRSYSSMGAPISHVDAKNSVEFSDGSWSRARCGNRGSFSMTARDDYIKPSKKDVFPLRGQVEDVTFPLGSKVAPNTSFTKIWRVWNTDCLVWPRGIKIRNVSASSGFAVVGCAELEIPARGLAAYEGVDISMYLKTPSSPGKYFAVWDLVPPSGFHFKHKQQISVSITVSADLGSAHNGSVDKVKSKPVDNPIKTETTGITIVEPTKGVRIPDVGVKCDLRKSASVACRGSEVGKTGVEGGDNLEESMMMELYEMGFYDKDMNLKILRSSNYDLDLSVDRLCDMTEDCMLDDDDMYY